MNENQLVIRNMQNEEYSNTLQVHQYYGPLIDSYTKSILKSSLLLDEDLEALLSISDFRNFSHSNSYRPSLGLLGSIISLLSCSLIAKRFQTPLILFPSVIFTLKSVALEVTNVRKRKSNIEIVDKLIETISKINKLNLSIIRYMKTRTDMGKTGNSFLILYNKCLKEFSDFLLKNNCQLFKFLISILKNISPYSSDLSDDYTCLINLDPLSILHPSNADNIENCLAITRKIQDLHILFASKFLSYVGIVCCSKASTLQENDLETLLNETLPNVVNILQQHHNIVKKRFVALRQSINKKSEYKLQAEANAPPNENRQISSKLQETLVCSVNNLSIILEKSQSVLDAVENAESVNLNEIGDAVIDLRNHTFATYESLDLLCKLYGILANSNSSERRNKITSPVKRKDDSEQKLPTINYDDATQPLEEKFELYIGDEDISDECSTTKYESDRSEEYLTLMLRELRQSLKQHQRFIDAKNRRGSDDDDETLTDDSHLKLKKSPSKFNLTVLRDECNQVIMDTSPPKSEEQRENYPPDIPAPPPPPLPCFNLDSLEEETGLINTRSMLDNIKALSSQRNVKEDVFGDSDVDSIYSDAD